MPSVEARSRPADRADAAPEHNDSRPVAGPDGAMGARPAGDTGRLCQASRKHESDSHDRVTRPDKARNICDDHRQPAALPRRPRGAAASSGDTERGFSRVFRWIATGSGALILAALAAVALFLIARAWPAVTANSAELADAVPRYPGDTSFIDLRGPARLRHAARRGLLALLLATPVAIGHRAVHLALRAAPAGPAHRLPGGPARGDPVGGLRPLGSPRPRTGHRSFWAWLGEYVGWFPLFAGDASPPAACWRPLRRARRDDPADHHRGLP